MMSDRPAETAKVVETPLVEPAGFDAWLCGYFVAPQDALTRECLRDAFEAGAASKARVRQLKRDLAQSHALYEQLVVGSREASERLRDVLLKAKAALGDACHATAIYGDEPPRFYLDALGAIDRALTEGGTK